MAAWLIFALLYPILLGISNLLDKFLVEKKVKNPRSYGVIAGAVLLVSAFVVWIFVGLPKMPGSVIFFGILSGVVYGCCYLIYYKIIKFAEISRVVGIAYAFPAFVALFSFLFLREQLSTLKYFAISLAIFGAIAIGIEHTKQKIKLGAVFWFMLLEAILIGVVDTADKYVVSNLSYWEAFILTTAPLGIFLMLQLLRKDARTDLKQALRHAHLIAVSETFCFVGAFVFLVAASAAPISIVSAIGTLQPAVVFSGTVLLSVFMPRLIKEAVGRKVLIYKIIGIALVVAAAIVLSI
jgi:uncharacterized membrane protein